MRQPHAAVVWDATYETDFVDAEGERVGGSDVAARGRVGREMFGEHRPASTAVQGSGLLLTGGKLEINVIALRADGAFHIPAAIEG